MGFSEFLETQILQIGSISITVGEVFAAILILIGTRALIWGLNRGILAPWFRRRNVDIGRQYTISQLLRYLVYTLATFLILEALGVRISVLLAGSAALLVGIGLALQDSFKDLVSGLIILGEGTIEVGDIVYVDDEVAKVTRIGLRSSRLETRNDISLIVPNSKLVTNTIANWSHTESSNRFTVSVGVAYGSDVDLVKHLLLEVANQHPDVLNDPTPKVQFANFGDSALEFIILFHCHRSFQIDFVKSDLRFAISESFKNQGVSIPFPQRDVWLRKAGLDD